MYILRSTVSKKHFYQKIVFTKKIRPNGACASKQVTRVTLYGVIPFLCENKSVLFKERIFLTASKLTFNKLILL